MRARFVLATAFAMGACYGLADDLWNQQVGVPAAYTSFPDQEFDDGIFDTFTTYMANDVIVGSEWNVSSVSIEMTASQPANFVTATTARLNVFANPGSLDVPAVQDNPVNGTIVPISITPYSGHSSTFFVEADNLDLNLSGGEYWIDLTPIGGIVATGESLEVYSPNNPAGALHGSAVINPGQGYMFASGPNWDTMQAENHTDGPVYGAIDIQGTPAPEPASLPFFAAGLIILVARRRDH